MGKKATTIRDLVVLVGASVKSGKIEKEYPDFLKCCQDMKVSSYVLNLLITKSKEKQAENNNNTIDNSFFVKAEQKTDRKDTKKADTQTSIKIVKKNSEAAWIVASFLFIGIIVEAACLYDLNIENKHVNNRVSELTQKHKALTNVLKDISSMTDNLDDDTSFSSWSSSNHAPKSESYTYYYLSASKGDKLSFNYFVSSEFNYDYLTITLLGNNTPSNELVKVSGDIKNSRSFVFKTTDNYSLHVKYSKDGTIDKNNDNAGISNINLHRNYKSLLDSIHSISSIYDENTNNISTYQ